jgi:hypothetical protein
LPPHVPAIVDHDDQDHSDVHERVLNRAGDEEAQVTKAERRAIQIDAYVGKSGKDAYHYKRLSLERV